MLNYQSCSIIIEDYDGYNPTIAGYTDVPISKDPEKIIFDQLFRGDLFVFFRSKLRKGYVYQFNNPKDPETKTFYTYYIPQSFIEGLFERIGLNYKG